MTQPPSHNILCIADVHLQPNAQHPINQAFRAFLQQEATQAKTLYILGDLFEMWVGDDIGLTTYAQDIQALKQLTASGVTVYLQFGNRDFLMRNAFWQTTGIHPLKQPLLQTLNNQPYLLLHGDSLCTEDKAYQRTRWLLRNPLITWLFLQLPAQKRQTIGQKMRNSSQKYNRNKAENIMDVSQTAIQQLLQKYPQSQGLIHGHTHRPAHHTHLLKGKNYHRWVLGDWQLKDQQVYTQILKLNPTPQLISWQYPIPQP